MQSPVWCSMAKHQTENSASHEVQILRETQVFYLLLMLMWTNKISIQSMTISLKINLLHIKKCFYIS